MSRQTVSEVLARVDMSPAFMSYRHEGQFVANMQELSRHSGMTREAERALADRRADELGQTYGFRSPNREKPFAYEDGVAVIPIHGTLINRYHGSWGYVTGYNFIRAQLNAAVEDEDVRLIVFDVNSYGGECAGCFELADEIRAARDTKQILAMVDSNCCSAAYALASAASKVYVTPSGQAGSIGVIAMHVNQAKMLEDWGIEITLIFAGDHKADGNPFESLPEDVRKDIQASVDKRYGEFVDLVVKNRGLDSQSVINTQAKSYRADEAKALRLIDEVKTPTEAVASFLAEMGSDSPNDNEEDEMSTTPAATGTAAPAAAPAAAAAPTTVDVNAAVAAALSAERQRMSGITSHEHAADRPKLAQHLAMNTDLSVEAAAGILAAAPKEAAAAAPAPAPKPKPKGEGAESTETVVETAGSHFQNAMDQAGGPNVGADGEDAEIPGATAPKASRAALAMQAAGMNKPKQPTAH